MAKVTYKPEAGASDETEQFGFKFAGGKATEVPDDSRSLAKFRGNPFFDVSGAKSAAASAATTAAEKESAAQDTGEQTSSEQPGTQSVSPGQADKPNGDSDLRAAHRGGGVYAVLKGDKDEVVVGGLTKDEADAFNSLDGKAKEAQVAEMSKAAGK